MIARVACSMHGFLKDVRLHPLYILALQWPTLQDSDTIRAGSHNGISYGCSWYGSEGMSDHVSIDFKNSRRVKSV